VDVAYDPEAGFLEVAAAEGRSHIAAVLADARAAIEGADG